MFQMVPVNGPQSKGMHFCPLHEVEKCQCDRFGLGCAHMHRVRVSARVRCQHNSQGRECPSLQVCTLNHLHPVNTSQLPWVYAIVEYRSRTWIGGGVEIGGGWGLQNEQFSGCVICDSNDSARGVSGLVMRTDQRAP